MEHRRSSNNTCSKELKYFRKDEVRDIKPILFNTTMVKAILDNKKTETRRVIKNKYLNADITFLGEKLVFKQNDAPADIIHDDGSRTCSVKACRIVKKPYEIGDILYVRETWCDANKDLVKHSDLDVGDCQYIFKVDDNGRRQPLVEGEVKNWRPSIHMPRIAARIFLRVINIRAERIQDMREEDFIKEGIREFTKDGVIKKYDTEPSMHVWSIMPRNPKDAFMKLWDSTVSRDNFTSRWEYNPWVWVIEFERL